MVVYEDGVEALLLAELCSLEDLLEWFVGRLEDPASEPDLILHRPVRIHSRKALGPLKPRVSKRKKEKLRGVLVFGYCQCYSSCVGEAAACPGYGDGEGSSWSLAAAAGEGQSRGSASSHAGWVEACRNSCG